MGSGDTLHTGNGLLSSRSHNPHLSAEGMNDRTCGGTPGPGSGLSPSQIPLLLPEVDSIKHHD